MKPAWMIPVACVALAFCAAPVWGSMFGEENVTLASILAELVDSANTLGQISTTANKIATTSEEVASVYERVNAGIDQLESYSFDEFVDDLRNDFDRQYPGIGKVEYASTHFDSWLGTHTTSPVSAYQAISAVAADVSAPLRDELKNHRTNIDRDLVLSSEASEGFATAEQAGKQADSFDHRIGDMAEESKTASPGRAQQLSAQASFMMLAEQSEVMRLLGRVVRMQSTRAALDYGARLDADNSVYERVDAIGTMADATGATQMVDFGAP